MTPPPRALLAAALATTLAVGIAVAASTPASPLVPDHIAVLAGSPTRLVYADYPMLGKDSPDYTRGQLHVMGKGGRNRIVGAAIGNTDPANPGRYVYSLVGTSITAYSAADPGHVVWWDLATHTHGLGNLPPGARWQGSAPGGWLLVEADRATVAIESTAGALLSFGQPDSAESTVTGAVESVAGPAGVVSVGTTSGTAVFQAWIAPESVIPLSLGADTGSTGIECGGASPTTVACVDRGIDGTGLTELTVPLDGTPATAVTGCGATPVALKQRAAWLCGPSKSHLFFSNGAPHRSKALISGAPLTVAFGRAVTTGPWERAIVSIRNASSPLRVLLEEPSPVVRYDDANLRSAADAVQAEALASGALTTASTSPFPAVELLAASDALVRAARTKNPSLRPADTRSIMGRVPRALRHHTHPRAPHHHIRATRTLRLFTQSVPARPSAGFGTHRPHGGAYPAPFRHADGVYVEPRLPMPESPTIAIVALRSAMQKLGLPYVWAGGGPSTFDCSGLVQWAYAHAGIHLIHYTGSQYNEGRLLKPMQILPGDLILFDHLVGRHHDIHHVGMYLGAGWMINAPYTGQYVSVVRVPGSIAGIVRP